jgi:hypothetical protein
VVASRPWLGAIQGGGLFALIGFGSNGALRVGAVGEDLTFGGHMLIGSRSGAPVMRELKMEAADGRGDTGAVRSVIPAPRWKGIGRRNGRILVSLFAREVRSFVI